MTLKYKLKVYQCNFVYLYEMVWIIKLKINFIKRMFKPLVSTEFRIKLHNIIKYSLIK